MSSMRDIKQRISNVSSSKQIIKAMDMVSSTKLNKSRIQLDGVRPIYHELKRLVNEIASHDDGKKHVYFEEKKVKNTLYIVLTSNRGLAGSYNNNIISKALEHMNQGKNERIFVVGSKGSEYLSKSGKNIIHSYTDIADANVYYGSEKFAKRLTEYYLSGEVEEVYIAYTHFDSILTYEPRVEKLLPIIVEDGAEFTQTYRKFEPSTEEYIENLVSLYMHMSLFRAISESHTSEHAARMINMDASGKNASELIDDLTNMYNRKRQTAITQELSEIVGSANILNKGGVHD